MKVGEESEESGFLTVGGFMNTNLGEVMVEKWVFEVKQ